LGTREAMSVPPEEPTRRVPVAPAVAREVPVAPAAAPAVVSDDVYWREQVISRLDGLRTAIALVGAIAVIALGLSIWALAREHQDRSGGTGVAARNEQIRELRSDVDTLRSQLGNRATTGQLDALSKQVAAAGQGNSGASASDAGAINALNKSVSQLSQQMTDLGQRVKALEDAASSGGGGTQTSP
jgi:methyl-accepting chemotaxis protein